MYKNPKIVSKINMLVHTYFY